MPSSRAGIIIRRRRARGVRGGFTLIELSIVLVIIGLIVGGILVGRDLIRSAQLKSVVTDVNRFVAAVNTFRTKYDNQLPGDMTNATTYWGASTSSCPGTPVGGGTKTCDGDGDGKICDGGAYGANGGCPQEGRFVWQHLSNAGMVAGSYTGGNTSAPPYYDVGGNVPQSSAFPGAGYMLYYYGPITNGPIFFIGSGINHVITFGMGSAVGHNNWADNPLYPVLSTQDAYSIDAKIDDGMPGTGKVFSLPKNSYFTPGNTATAACSTGPEHCADRHL